MNKHKMAKIIYTTYQTNSFKIIKSTFSIDELPHAPYLGIFNCFETSDRAENFQQTLPIYGWWGGGGAVAPPEFPPLSVIIITFSTYSIFYLCGSHVGGVCLLAATTKIFQSLNIHKFVINKTHIIGVNTSHELEFYRVC